MANLDFFDSYEEEKDFSDLYIEREGLDEQFNKEISNIRKEIETGIRKTESHVINDYGIGGIGKSQIEEHLIRLVKEKKEKNEKIQYICFDFFDGPKTKRDFIESFLELMNNIGINDFYCTTSAIIKLCEKEGKPFTGEVTTTLEEYGKTKTAQILSMVIKHIPTIGSLIGTVEEMNRILNDPNDRSVDEMLSVLEKKAEKINKASADCIRSIRFCDLSKDKYNKKLIEFLIRDLGVIMLTRKEPLVIFIDTYENQINTFTGVLTTSNADEEWLRKLIKEVPYVLWVISGREKLEKNDEKGWLEIGHISNEIECFTEEEIKRYMANMDVDHSLFPLFSKLSDGIPFFLELLCNSYKQNIVKGKEIALNESNYGFSKVDIPDRYLKSFVDDDTKKLLIQLAAIEGGWNEKMLEAGVVEGIDKLRYAKLIRASLIKYYPENQKYRMPEPIRKAILDFADPETVNETRQRLSVYFSDVVRNENDSAGIRNIEQLQNYSNIEDKESIFLELIVPRINSYLAFYKMEEVKILLDNYREAFSLSKNKKFKASFLAMERDYYIGRRNYEIALEKSKECYHLLKEELGENHPDTLTSLSYIAICLGNLGKYDEAMEKLRECYESRRNVLGENHPDTLHSLHDISSCLSFLGKYEEAVEKSSECYEIQREALGENNPDTLDSLNNIAVCLDNLGKHGEASVKLRECYEVRKKVLGKSHPDTLFSLYCIATNIRHLGKYGEALEKHKECYEARRNVLGENHPETLRSLNGIAACLGNLGKHDEALEKHKECYEARRNVLGENHPDTLRSLSNIASSLSHLRKYDEALEKSRECYEVRKKVLGKFHPDTLTSLSYIASCLGFLGKYEEAVEKSRECYEARRKILGETNPETLRSLNGIAVFLDNLGKHDEALEKHKECYEARRNVLGENHPDTLRSLSNIASSLGHLRKYDEALEKSRECYEARRNVLGENHPDTIRSLSDIASCLGFLGKYEEAVEKSRECYEAQRKILGESHADTLLSLYNIAVCLDTIGDHREALDKHKKCYEARKDVLGESHEDTLLSLYNIAVCYGNLGQYKEALEIFRKCYESQRKILGESHADTLLTHNNMEFCRKRLEQYKHQDAPENRNNCSYYNSPLSESYTSGKTTTEGELFDASEYGYRTMTKLEYAKNWIEIGVRIILKMLFYPINWLVGRINRVRKRK